MAEELEMNGTVKADPVAPDHIIDRRNGTEPKHSPNGPRPGAGDFAIQQGGGFPPLPVELITVSHDEKDFYSNLLRTDAGTHEDVLDEMSIHASESYRKYRRVDRLSLMQGIRIARTAEGGRARKEFLAGIGAMKEMLMSRTGGLMSDLGRIMNNGQGKQQ